MTQETIDALAKASSQGLQSLYKQDGYIYQVDENDNPVPYHGIQGKLNPDSTDSCITCKVHTKEAWEKYKQDNPWIDNPNVDEPGTEEPGTEEPGTEEPTTGNPGDEEGTVTPVDDGEGY